MELLIPNNSELFTLCAAQRSEQLWGFNLNSLSIHTLMLGVMQHAS